MTTIMTIRAPEDMQHALSEKAQSAGLTRNALVLQILQEWLKKG